MGVSCALVGCWLLLSADGVPIEGVSRIDIPHRENGYKSFPSGVLESQDELDKFLNRAKQDRGWGQFEKFTGVIEHAKVDFTKESLVLVRHTEGSGSIGVRFRLSGTTDGTLAVNVYRHVPVFATCDMAEYCCAFKVQRARERRVEIWKQADTLDISPKR